MLASGDGANAALIWNLRTRALIKLPIGKGDWVQSLAFGADGQHLMTVTMSNRGDIWNLRSHRLAVPTFEVDQPGPLAPFAVAGATRPGLFAYGSNGTIALRSSTTGRPVGQPIPVPSGYAGAIALSPDGHTVALTADDGVELWNTQTHSQVGASLPGAPTQTSNPGGPGGVAFADAGRRLLIISPSGLITIWNLSPSVWAEQACQIAGRAITPGEWAKFIPDRSFQPICPTRG
jgi:WD40 repeat protein